MVIKQTVNGFFRPWDQPPKTRTPMGLLHRLVWTRANPRSESYMRDLFVEHFPDGMFVPIDQKPEWRTLLHQSDVVVLLYPDSIGQGYRLVEQEARTRKKPEASLQVLNGRRRLFLLNGATLRDLRWRRFLERWMVLESMALLIFVLVTPCLLIIDWARGRR